jgi:REP element-mobilizing transposase RayT
MSQPRQVLPNATYLVTRRTSFRHMLFAPDRIMNQILVYLLAVVARREGILVHALCAMSTHTHLVVTDVRGTLPTFLHAFHRLVAMCTKAYRRWNDAVWDKDPTSVVQLLTPAAVVEKIAYVLANPVAAGLVERAHQWPGAKVGVDQLGQGTLRASRPSYYLDPKNPAWPDDAEIPISLPPYVEPAQAGVLRGQVEAELSCLEAVARADLARRRLRFLGAERARAVAPTARATSQEPRLDRRPTFAVGRGQEDASRQAVKAVRAFRRAYRAVLDQWRAGVRDVVFPAGTWWMRVFHGACVAGIRTA